MDKKGIVYILKNSRMPDLIKIGYTKSDLKKRVGRLRSTGVPEPFTIHYACEVDDPINEERWLHDIFADRRYRSDREFFTVDAERAVAALRKVALKDVTPKKLEDLSEEQKDEVERNSNRKSNFDFKKYNISIGSELYFRNLKKTAVVTDDNRVIFNGSPTSHSEAARIMLGVEYGVNGCLYWKYDGETLNERRKRMDNNKEKEETLFDSLNKQ
jgi:hypothetical protein